MQCLPAVNVLHASSMTRVSRAAPYMSLVRERSLQLVERFEAHQRIELLERDQQIRAIDDTVAFDYFAFQYLDRVDHAFQRRRREQTRIRHLRDTHFLELLRCEQRC